MKPIRLSAHALGYTSIRGFTTADVETAIRTTEWKDTDRPNRKECHKDFVFDEEWNGKHYAIRRVRPIFVEEEREIVIITVYTYYFQEKT